MRVEGVKRMRTVYIVCTEKAILARLLQVLIGKTMFFETSPLLDNIDFFFLPVRHLIVSACCVRKLLTLEFL
jgi:hypothetical protein